MKISEVKIMTMTPRERFLTAINHEEPDRIPIFDLGIDSVPILEKYGGKGMDSLLGLIRLIRILMPFWWRRFIGWAANRTFVYKQIGKAVPGLMKKLGYDATFCPVTLFFTKCAFPSKSQYVDEVGRQFLFSKAESGGKEVVCAVYERGYFDTEDPEAAYEDWGLLDPDHKSRAAAYKASVKEAKDDIYVAPSIIGPLEATWECFGFTTFTKLLFKKPQFIEKVFRDRGDFIVAVAQNMLDLGAETILILDDAGFKGSPFLSPKMYEKYVGTQLKRVTNLVHSAGAKVMMHSCGDLTKLLDILVKVGIDALHPIESMAGMDIFKVKETYGDKLTLIGNVPIDMLSHGTPQDVEEYVKKLIKICAPGGGYMLSTSHSVSYSVDVENYERMLETGLKYGNYPINIE